jgi:hypothetical protein
MSPATSAPYASWVRAVDENRMIETGTLDRIATVDEI